MVLAERETQDYSLVARYYTHRRCPSCGCYLTAEDWCGVESIAVPHPRAEEPEAESTPDNSKLIEGIQRVRKEAINRK